LPAPVPVSVPTDEATGVIVWNDAAAEVGMSDWFARQFGIQSGKPLAFGVLQGEPDQRHLLEQIDDSVRRLVIIVKGWEPPLLEFSDFLYLVRDKLGSEVSITLVPLDVTGTTVLKDERDVWAGMLARQQDPRLYVVEAESGRGVTR
jgi:hypothetical protein